MTDFTTGPWRWEACSIGTPDERINIVDDSQIICTIHGYSDHPQHIAFANMICAKRDTDAAIKSAVEQEREECAKIADRCKENYHEHAAKAVTSMNRALNALGATTCSEIAHAIRERQ